MEESSSTRNWSFSQFCGSLTPEQRLQWIVLAQQQGSSWPRLSARRQRDALLDRLAAGIKKLRAGILGLRDLAQ